MNVVQRTFFEGLVNTSLSLSKAFVSFDVREHSALVYPVVVVRTEEEHGEVPQVVLEALDVEWHRPGVADLRWPPPESRRMKSHYALRGCWEPKNKGCVLRNFYSESKDTKYLAYL